MTPWRAIVLAGIAGLSLGEPAWAVPPPPPSGVQIDCGRTAYASEQLICGDRTLMQREAAMSDLYSRAAAKVAPANRGVLEEGQRAWMRERNLCAFQADGRACVLLQYQARETSLRALIGPGRR